MLMVLVYGTVYSSESIYPQRYKQNIHHAYHLSWDIPGAGGWDRALVLLRHDDGHKGGSYCWKLVGLPPSP